MRLGLKIAGNMAAVVAGKATVIGVGLLSFAMIARHLGTAGLGEYRIVLTVLAFSGMAADFGIYAMTLRKIALNRNTMGPILGNALACRLACTVSAVGLVCMATWLMDGPASLRIGLLVAGIGWVAYQASEFMVGVFQEKMRQDYVALTEAAAALVTFAGIFTMTRIQPSLHAMLGATAFGFMFCFIARFFLAQKLVAFRLRFDLPNWWALMKSGLPVAASSALILIYVRGDVMLLAYFHSPTQVGIYDIAAKIYEISTNLPHLFGGLLLPLLTRDFQSAGDRYRERLGGALTAVVVVVVAAGILLGFYAGEVAVLLAGPAFKATAGPLRILACSVVLAAPSYILRFGALAAGRQRQMLRIDIVAVICGVSAYWLLIPTWSYLGAAAGKCLVDATILLGAAYVTSPRGAWRRCWRPLAEVLMAGAVLAALLWGLGETHLPWYISAGCGMAAYLLTLIPMPELRQRLRRLSAE